MSGKYTIMEVEGRTRVPASTLRQWERRYGFPQPDRSDAGYRLYSDHDLRQIEVMKHHIEDGVPASRAAELAQEPSQPTKLPRPAPDLAHELVAALTSFDEVGASDVLSDAFALHSVETVLLQVIKPAMILIGERWHAGEDRTTAEHFACNVVQARLRSLLGLTLAQRRSPRVLIACAPQERHEIGALILAVLLRRAGFDVIFLGADTPVDDLAELTRSLKPEVVFISAMRPDTLECLVVEGKLLRAVEPLLIFGGQAFELRPELATSLGGVFLGNELQNIDGRIRKLLEGRGVQQS